MTCRLNILRLAIIITGIALLHASCRADSSISDIFVNAPRHIIASLDSLTRVEMLLYHEAGSSTPSKNNLDGSSRIISRTPETITFSTSKASEVTIARIPSSKDSVILCLNTVSTPALDTNATLYTISWQQLPDKAQLPSINNLDLWLTPEGRKHRAEVENAVPFITARCTYEPATHTITAVSTIRRLIGRDNYATVDPFLKPSLLFKWNGKKWNLIKD